MGREGCAVGVTSGVELATGEAVGSTVSSAPGNTGEGFSGLRPQACNTKAVAPPKREPIKPRRLRRIPSNEESKEEGDDESDISSLFKLDAFYEKKRPKS